MRSNSKRMENAVDDRENESIHTYICFSWCLPARLICLCSSSVWAHVNVFTCETQGEAAFNQKTICSRHINDICMCDVKRHAGYPYMCSFWAACGKWKMRNANTTICGIDMRTPFYAKVIGSEAQIYINTFSCFFLELKGIIFCISFASSKTDINNPFRAVWYTCGWTLRDTQRWFCKRLKLRLTSAETKGPWISK